MRGFVWCRVDDLKRVFYLADPQEERADLVSVHLIRLACRKGWAVSC